MVASLSLPSPHPPPSLPHSLPPSLPPSPHPRVSVSGCCDCRSSTTHALRLTAAERLRQLDSRSLQRRVAAIGASLSSPLRTGVQLGNCHRFLFVFLRRALLMPLLLGCTHYLTTGSQSVSFSDCFFFTCISETHDVQYYLTFKTRVSMLA